VLVHDFTVRVMSATVVTGVIYLLSLNLHRHMSNISIYFTMTREGGAVFSKITHQLVSQAIFSTFCKCGYEKNTKTRGTLLTVDLYHGDRYAACRYAKRPQ
jgi:hypothetical protein